MIYFVYWLDAYSQQEYGNRSTDEDCHRGASSSELCGIQCEKCSEYILGTLKSSLCKGSDEGSNKRSHQSSQQVSSVARLFNSQ